MIDAVDTNAQSDPTEYQGVVITDRPVVESPEDVDYDTMAPKAATAAMFNQGGPKRDTFMFRLIHTGIKHGENIAAEVRLVNLTDRATLSQVAPEVRETVQRLFFSGTPNQRGTKKETPQQRMDNQLKRLKEVGYAYGVAGFVNPRLVMDPEDVRDPEKETWVGNIELADLTEYVRICEGDDQLANRRLEQFSE